MSKHIGTIFGIIFVAIFMSSIHFISCCTARPNNCDDTKLIESYNKIVSKQAPLNANIIREFHTMDWKCNNFHKNGYYEDSQIDMLIEKKVEADINILK